MEEIMLYSRVIVKSIREDLFYTISEGNASIGDFGTVVGIYHSENHPDGYEVECTDIYGNTKWMAIFHKDDLVCIPGHQF